MKHFLWLFILIPLVCYGADSKITDLPDVGASSDDVMYVVDNPGLSTASDNKITLGNLLLFFATQDMTLTGTIDASGATITFPTSITLDTPTFVLADDSTITPPAAAPTADGLPITCNNSDSTCSFATSLSSIDITGGTASTPAVWDANQKLTALTTQNVITTGYIDGGILVTKSTAATVTVTGMSGYYVNADDDAIEFDLPADPTNKGYCFANTLYAKGITVDPDASDYIIMDGVAGEAGEAVVSTGAADEQLCVIGIDSSYWKVTSKVGTWAQETPP